MIITQTRIDITMIYIYIKKRYSSLVKVINIVINITSNVEHLNEIITTIIIIIIIIIT